MGRFFADSGTEATVAEKVLLELSVPPQQIFTDTEARNTTENAVNVAALCREQQWQKIVLVTSAFHMPRSVLNFADKGLDIVPFPCDYQLSGKMQLSIFSLYAAGVCAGAFCNGVKGIFRAAGFKDIVKIIMVK